MSLRYQDTRPSTALQPHRSETFKLSADPLFVDKVRDIVGLYLDPPERALVLCETQPLLPMRPGQVERRTHDYIRQFSPPANRCENSSPAQDLEDGQLRDPLRPLPTWLAGHPRWHVHFTPTGASWRRHWSASSRC